MSDGEERMTTQLSRSEQKRRMKQLEKFVQELSQLPATVVTTLPCDEAIRDLVVETSSLKGGSRKRQIKYITKLLKNEKSESLDELYEFLSKRRGNALQNAKEFHEIEYLRDALLSEAIEQRQLAQHRRFEWEEDWSSRILSQVLEEFPEIDRKLLSRLAWLYAETRNRKHRREIFRILRSAQEQKRYVSVQTKNIK